LSVVAINNGNHKLVFKVNHLKLMLAYFRFIFRNSGK